MKVLVAEDDRATLGRISALLQSWGHECLPASDGAAAWKLLQEHRPPLVITDWVMPDVDGLTLLKQIREQSLQPAYVIFLTGKESMSHLVEAMESGADDFIRKPFDSEELRVRVRAGARIMEQQHQLEKANEELAMAYLKLHVANGRMRSELQAAAEIQDAFLPSSPPPTEHANFAWYHKTCEAHSGDTFNFVPLDQDRVGVYVASFSGHGVGSTLMSAQLSLTMSRPTGNEPGPLPVEEPAEVARWLNDRFRYFDRLRYFTFLYGILDFRRMTFRYTSAAHPGPIVISRGRARVRKLTPPAVGIREDAQFKNQLLHLHPGDRLFLYNSGFFEMENFLGDTFTEEILAELLVQETTDPLDDGLRRAGEKALEWGKADDLKRDLCLVGVEISSGSEPA
jgi:sigma-B regulation protein RsbU (phosphoserine phosphatase)